ncbi:hypothetical protein ULF88_25725 [Halopseudomonas pachastrellae]|nr:hypothetical protein [Halopseudomonas pachastrellae]
MPSQYVMSCSGDQRHPGYGISGGNCCQSYAILVVGAGVAGAQSSALMAGFLLAALLTITRDSGVRLAVASDEASCAPLR